MTDQELQLQHDKVSAEIANLNALTAKAIADISKVSLETTKLNKEIKWYEVVIISGATLVIVAIVKLFF